jgi:hypothetical protein
MRTYISFYDNELWESVILNGRATVYKVSNYGQVMNKTTGKILKPYIFYNKQGTPYHRVVLYIDTIPHKISLHRLVLMMFKPIDNPEDFVGNHKDLDTLNNKLLNLEWATQKQNIEHAMANNRIALGEDRRETIFTNRQVHALCYILEKYLPKGILYRDVLIMAGIDPSLKNIDVLNKIKLRKNWRSISDKYEWDAKYNYNREKKVQRLERKLIEIK